MLQRKNRVCEEKDADGGSFKSFLVWEGSGKRDIKDKLNVPSSWEFLAF
jgi:hypothetical protein